MAHNSTPTMPKSMLQFERSLKEQPIEKTVAKLDVLKLETLNDLLEAYSEGDPKDRLRAVLGFALVSSAIYGLKPAEEQKPSTYFSDPLITFMQQEIIGFIEEDKKNRSGLLETCFFDPDLSVQRRIGRFAHASAFPPVYDDQLFAAGVAVGKIGINPAFFASRQ